MGLEDVPPVDLPPSPHRFRLFLQELCKVAHRIVHSTRRSSLSLKGLVLLTDKGLESVYEPQVLIRFTNTY